MNHHVANCEVPPKSPVLYMYRFSQFFLISNGLGLNMEQKPIHVVIFKLESVYGDSINVYSPIV